MEPHTSHCIDSNVILPVLTVMWPRRLKLCGKADGADMEMVAFDLFARWSFQPITVDHKT